MLSEVQHECPLGKSDHEVFQTEIDEECEEIGLKNHKERRNYNRAKYNDLRAIFGSINW